MGFDVDSCCCGFDGSRAFVLPRTQRAINKEFNLVDMSRRSLTYETRLFKYSQRGFAVGIPDFDRSHVDPELFEVMRYPRVWRVMRCRKNSRMWMDLPSCC
jgi:hypothetical protein